MGANESSSSPPSSIRRYGAPATRRGPFSDSDGPDRFHVLRVEAERQEVQIGSHRMESQRVRMVTVNVGSDGIHVSEQERTNVEIRLGAQRQRSPLGIGFALADSSDDDSEDGKCTYDDMGPGHFVQPWFKCCTCWGDDADESSFGCCSHCANTCHRGHRLIREALAKGECDCGHYKHQTAVCTWHVTRRQYTKQPFYRCYDCFSQPNEGVCYQCWKICHRTHATKYVGIMSAFCDCGLNTCRIKCSIPAPK